MEMVRPSFKVYAGILLCLTLASVADAQRSTDREEREYKGKVKTVRTYIVDYAYDNGRMKTGKRHIDELEQFDRTGNLIRDIDYDDDGKVLSDEKRVFQNNRLAETLRKHSPFSNLSDRATYKYDLAGNLIAEDGYDLAGKLVTANVYEYDDHNRKIRWTSKSYFKNEDKRAHRWEYAYDDQGRLTDERKFLDAGNGFIPTDDLGAPHRRQLIYGERGKTEKKFNSRGQLLSSSEIRYDDQGNELEDIQFDQKGELKGKTRYEYVFDRQGNWTVQKTYQWETENGQGFYRLDEVSHRTISFYR